MVVGRTRFVGNMKFEEQFPNIKISVQADYKVRDLCYTAWTMERLLEDIQEHCLDKQKVREAIDKVFDMSDEEDAVHNAMIKKELGL